jgi:hypothetical protein
MSTDKNEQTGMRRREFLKVGLVGTTSAMIGGNVLAEAAVQYAENAPFVFPQPVHRILGRTGLKVSVVSFGAMLTPEPEVLMTAFDNGLNYVDTARKYMDGRNEEIVAKALKGRRDRVYVATKTLPRRRDQPQDARDRPHRRDPASQPRQ